MYLIFLFKLYSYVAYFVIWSDTEDNFDILQHTTIFLRFIIHSVSFYVNHSIFIFTQGIYVCFSLGALPVTIFLE